MIAVVDLDSVMFSIANPNKVLDDTGQPLKVDGKFVYEEKSQEQLVDSAEFIMNKILTSCSCDSYITYIKGKGNYRYNYKQDYKANRPKESPKWWSFVKGYLMMNWNAKEVNGIEVDDAVNITRLAIPDSFICAIDNDLLGLEGKHFNWRKNDLNGEWVHVTKEQANYKFWSDMICGQKGDNIQGLKGKGEVFVKNLFEENERSWPNNEALEDLVFKTYQYYYKDFTIALDEYYSNYKCLKILDCNKDFNIPEPVKYLNQKSIEISEEKGLFE